MELNRTIEEGEVFSPAPSSNPINGIHQDSKTISKSSNGEISLIDVSDTSLVESPQTQYGQTPFTPFGDPNKKQIGLNRRTPFSRRKSFLDTPASQKKFRTKILKNIKNKVIKRLKKTFHFPKKNSETIHQRKQTPKPISKRKTRKLGKPRPIVVDGSNMAMGYGKEVTGKAQFICKGIQICVKYLKDQAPFKHNRHQLIVVVPEFRMNPGKSIDTEILHKLSKEGIVKLTPGGTTNGRHFSCYDDNFIVKFAHETGGIIISNDKYRDLKVKKPEWSTTIDNRCLQFKWFGNKLMFPEDPKGKYGPDLKDFILFKDGESENASP